MTSRRISAGGLAALLGCLGCYQPQPLDARAVMADIDAEARASGPRRGGGASAATPAGPPGVVTESEAVATALGGNPDLRAARRQRGIAEGEIVLAGAVENPEFDLDYVQHESAYAVGLRWEPPQPGIYRARRAAARAGAAAVEAEVSEAEWQVAIAVRSAHATLLAITEKRALVEKAIQGRREIAALIARRVQGGASTRIDLGLAESAIVQSERDRDDLAAQEIAARTTLGQLMGTTPPSGATGTLPDDAAGPAALEPLVEAALAGRPALMAAEKRYLQREETVRLEHARRWPWFRLTAAPRYRYDSDISSHGYALGLRLILPIFDQNQGGIQVAEATRDQERERFRKQVLGLRRDLENARAVITLRSETLRRYQTQILPGLEAQERMVALAASGGQLDTVAILHAADSILRSRREYVDTRLAMYRARLDLERAVGPRR